MHDVFHFDVRLELTDESRAVCKISFLPMYKNLNIRFVRVTSMLARSVHRFLFSEDLNAL